MQGITKVSHLLLHLSLLEAFSLPALFYLLGFLYSLVAALTLFPICVTFKASDFPKLNRIFVHDFRFQICSAYSLYLWNQHKAPKMFIWLTLPPACSISDLCPGFHHLCLSVEFLQVPSILD